MVARGLTTAPGDVVLVALDPSKGREQQKTRPCLVVSKTNPLGLVIVLPVTDGIGKTSKLFVPIPDLRTAGLAKPSVVDTFQVRCLDPVRFKKSLGSVGDEVLHPVRSALAAVFAIDEEHLP
jgi:mRNA interferase MazF